MLQTSFSREGMNSYMIVSFEKEFPTGYQNSLFQHHNVPYFLQYEVREVDGKQAVYYRLKYHTAVKSVIGHLPFTLERLKNMAGSVIGALETADEYLLDADRIIWQADKIFLDAETGKLQFCYCAAEGEKQGDLKGFLSEIIQAVGKRDEEAVLFLLQFYNLVTEPGCTLEHLQKFRKDYLEGKIQIQNEKEEEPERNSISFGAPLSEKDNLSQAPEEKDEKPSIGERIVKMILIADAVISLVLVAGLFFHVFTYDHMQFLFISVGGLIILTIIYMQMTKEESADTIMQDFFENQKTASGGNPEKRDKEIQIAAGGKEQGNDFNGKPSKTEVYGETGILAGDKSGEGKEKTVSEEEEGELYLKPMEKDKYPSIHVNNSIVLGCMTECCNYVLSERGVSRMHAKLMKKPDGVYLLDLNSTNGTYLNGKLIESGKDYKLEEGDMVAFALSEFYAAVEHETNSGQTFFDFKL